MVMKSARKSYGFTIVELVIVIAVIAILAAISIVAYNGIQERARNTKITQDLESLQKSISLARTFSGKTLTGITGAGYTANSCVSKAAGTNLATLAKTDSCWANYTSALTKIYEAGGGDVRGLVDPWGRPYFIDENEGESSTSCNMDVIAAYAYPFNNGSRTNSVTVPLSGYSGCSTT